MDHIDAELFLSPAFVISADDNRVLISYDDGVAFRHLDFNVVDGKLTLERR